MARPEKILIVDDSPESIRLMAKVLADFQVFAAKSGQEALVFVHANPVDLILLDMSMPEMNGFSVLENLKSATETCDIPVLFVTADNSLATESTVLNAGAADFIGKPINPEVLLSRVRTQLKLLAQQNTLKQHNQSLESLVQSRTKELIEALAAAQAADRAKTLFLGNMSHEMKTPLHQISGLGELLKREPMTDKGLARLSQLDTAVRRLDTVISGILELVNLESGASKVSYTRIQFPAFLNDIAKLVSREINEKPLSLRIECAEELPSELLGDRSHLRTITACYLNNALRYSESGTVTLRLKKEREDEEYVLCRLEVQDEGPGISPENLSRIFEYFEQVDNSHTRKFGGTGVGLSLVLRLAQLMGGTAGCESELGQGSLFWATFKLRKQASPPPSAVSHDYQI